MAKVELKQPIVAAIAEDVKDAQSVVIVDYRGLTVAQDTELRKQLREAGIIYKVCKNTMMKRAFEGTEFEIKLSLTTVNSDLYEIWMNFSPTSPFIRRSMFRHRPFM